MKDTKLTELYGRINALLDDTLSLNDEIKAIIVGAFYSLNLAIESGYTDDLNKGISDDYLKNIMRSINQTEKEKWIAGFYFNSTLYRISAAYHRVLKVFTARVNSRDNIGRLLILAREKGLSDTDIRNLKDVHESVNYFKHEVYGLNNTERPSLETVIGSLKEILAICENLKNIS